jgi:hypothetical protein
VTHPSWDDDVLVAELRAALAERAEVPPDLVAAARAAFAWRTVDEELLLLEPAFDSAAPQGALAVRSAPTTTGGSGRLLVFDGAGYRIDLEIDDVAGIVGQVTPAGEGTVRGETAHGVHDEAPIDEVGCFQLRGPATGVLRVRAEVGGRMVSTGWINLGGSR